MNIHRLKLTVVVVALVCGGAMFLTRGSSARGVNDPALDDALGALLGQHGFTRRVGQSLEERLGRKVDNQLADLGRLAFHDSLLGLADDNSCAGCHAAPAGFGDTQSIAIGVGNNGVVGPDRYAFRTSPLRNVALQPTFFHNGAFTRLEDALRFHLDAAAAAPAYDPAQAGVDVDLRVPLGPTQPVLDRLDPLAQTPVALDGEEFRQLLAFVRGGLQDPRATPEKLRKLIPKRLPSGRPVHLFQ